MTFGKIDASNLRNEELHSVGVFWMDRWQGDARFPQKWSFEVHQDGRWQPIELYTTGSHDTCASQYNVAHPSAPTRCDAIRVRMTPKEETGVGSLELIAECEEK